MRRGKETVLKKVSEALRGSRRTVVRRRRETELPHTTPNRDSIAHGSGLDMEKYMTEHAFPLNQSGLPSRSGNLGWP
jgi:hypothetical protein